MGVFAGCYGDCRMASLGFPMVGGISPWRAVNPVSKALRERVTGYKLYIIQICTVEQFECHGNDIYVLF